MASGTGSRGVRRAEERASRRRATQHRVVQEYPTEVYSRLAKTAREHGVSVRVWVKALVLESTGIRPLLTQEPPEMIKRIVEERFSH